MKKIIIVLLFISCSLSLAHEGHLDFSETKKSKSSSKKSKVIKVEAKESIIEEKPSEEKIETPIRKETAETKIINNQLKTKITSSKDVSAASNKKIRQKDFENSPLSKSIDILNTIPGMYTIQHSGGGKATQYFLRGFDLDHGTDIDLRLDNIPLNMVSHGHGQGYTDGNFMIPELLSGIEVLKGSYKADQGNLSTAASIRLKTIDKLKQNTISVTKGSFDTMRVFAGVSPQVTDKSTILMAGEIYKTDGPFTSPENLNKFNLFTKYTYNLDESSKISLSGSLYRSDWNASGQIPLRAVESGQLGRFDTLDASDGGETKRDHISLNYLKATDDSELTFNAYLVQYDFFLLSNFTFYSADPVNGDQIKQTDDRQILGGELKWKKSLQSDSINNITLGTSWRKDNIDNSLNSTKEGQHLANIVNHSIREENIAVFVESEKEWSDFFSTVVGLRYDAIKSNVLDNNNSGETEESDNILQPKINLIFSTSDNSNVFINYGRSFHSNDSRGIMADPKVNLITKSDTVEVGFRQSLDKLDYSISLYNIELDNEVVWVGDAGVSEEKLGSTRRGVEIETRYALKDNVILDLDLNYTQSKLKTDSPDDAVPLAPEFMSGAGITVNNDLGYYGRLGMFHLGDRYGSEDRYFKIKGFTRFDLSAGKKSKNWDVSVKIQNLFDAQIKEAQFVNTSRMQNESSCGGNSRADNSNGFVGCEDVHFTPGNPFNLSLKVSYLFD